MIVNVRGPCGAGKSTLVREFVENRELLDTFMSGRGHVLGSVFGPHPGLFVPGHYKIDNGGLDYFVRKLDEAYDMVKRHALMGRDVLMEGAATTDHGERLAHLAAIGISCVAVFLDVPIEVCRSRLAEKAARRCAVHTEQRIVELVDRVARRMPADAARLTAGGVEIAKFSENEDALAHLRTLLMP